MRDFDQIALERAYVKLVCEGLAVDTGFTEADADPKELALGIEIEMEHTQDREIAKRIALDHLAEDPKYYSKLSAAGL